MGFQTVTVVSRRPYLRARLAGLLGRVFEIRCESDLRVADLLLDSSRRPGLLLIDVVKLLAEPPTTPLTPEPEGLPALFVVGSKADSDAIVPAMGEGVPVYILEQLEAEQFLSMVDAATTSDLFVGISRLSAQAVHGFLARRWARLALTAQERRVLELIGQGYSNPGIAEVLGVAEKTVKNYITGIYGKLGITNRHQAIATATYLLNRAA